LVIYTTFISNDARSHEYKIYKAWVASWRSSLLETFTKHSTLNSRGAKCKNRVEIGFVYDQSSVTAAVLKGQFKDISLYDSVET
jgi:hypothetical protein